MHAALAPQLLAWLTALASLWKAISSAFGLRRIPILTTPAFDLTPPNNPAITVIVPACNEQDAIAACIQSLLAQDYPHLHILAMDDRSTDQTGAILDNLAATHPQPLTVLHITTLPPGWLGKTHAMALAARHALAVHAPEWLLFSDGDVLFHPQCIRRSLVAAEREQADHFVTLPTALIRSTSEGIVMGFLQVLGLWATRLWRVSDPRSRDAVGIGAFNLIRTSAYTQLGGFESLRMEILEDLTLARRVKQAGLRQRCAFAPGYVSIHWAPGASGIIRTMTKNLFAIFRFHASLLLLACAWLALFCIGPFAAVLWSPTRTPALLSLLAIASMYRTTGRFSGIPTWTFFTSPIAAALFIYSMLRSTLITLKNGGVEWRGTFYPLAELRNNTGKLL